ncbi:uncharacterized protein BJX67DRAFT_108737 [Aspergillus lucknowensis]|uniref:Uncharacterized protein n=1 Tax=Aspergillus lucknowensis TaxID=176173 RepID=A0ABR4LRS1_9EURO
MPRFSRTWSIRSLSSSPPSQPPSTMRRQDAPARYIVRWKLQELLEGRFPDHPGLNFHIRLSDDVWSFDAPEEVTEVNLKSLNFEMTLALHSKAESALWEEDSSGE